MPIQHLDLAEITASTSSIDGPKRRKLDELSTTIAKAKRVIVVSGAGISCSSGIPDFRSENGLYSLVKKRYPDTFVTGKDLFSAGTLNNPQTTSVFLTFIAELSRACNAAQPTRTHHFIQKLDRSGKLLRSYTQNVDGFERRLGMESGGRGKGLSKTKSKNVELHGDLGRVRCVLCYADYEATSERVDWFDSGEMPDCPECEQRCNARVKKGSRATTTGLLRPSIVLYDEPHPLGDAIGDLQEYDIKRGPDLLLIMGTSLKVHGLKQLVKDFAKRIHEHENPARRGIVVFVNQTKPGKEWEGIIDVHVEGETDKWVERVERTWKSVRPGDWEVQTKLDGAVAGQEGVPVGGKGAKKGAVASQKRQTKPKKNVNGTIFNDAAPPTPKRSVSPSASSPLTQYTEENSSELSSAPSLTPQTTPTKIIKSHTPLTPISPPSPKRKNLGSPTSESPSKAQCVRSAPFTGVPSSSGRGNLFASPKKDTVDTVASSVFEDEPVTTMMGGKKVGKQIKGRSSQAEGSGGKENISPTAKVVSPVVMGKEEPIEEMGRGRRRKVLRVLD